MFKFNHTGPQYIGAYKVCHSVNHDFEDGYTTYDIDVWSVHNGDLIVSEEGLKPKEFHPVIDDIEQGVL